VRIGRGGTRSAMLLPATLLLLAGCRSGTSSGQAGPSSERPSVRPSAVGSSAVPYPTEVPFPRPSIVWKPIPYPTQRRKEMAAYARRHYGMGTFRLEDPRVIVEHFTVSKTFAPVFSLFSRDVPDQELHELPGLCAHFVIDTDGTIYQLVPLAIMCRHTVGLNYTAIGIEDVAMTAQEVLRNPRQLAASLRLTLWLMQRLHIELRNVIGHAESLTSPFRRELVARLRCQTHGDWNHAEMDPYRRKLASLARRYPFPLGPPPRPVASGC
jgi:N-acetylmuramoyl-L-alanine amidase-like protein